MVAEEVFDSRVLSVLWDDFTEQTTRFQLFKQQAKDPRKQLANSQVQGTDFYS